MRWKAATAVVSSVLLVVVAYMAGQANAPDERIVTVTEEVVVRDVEREVVEVPVPTVDFAPADLMADACRRVSAFHDEAVRMAEEEADIITGGGHITDVSLPRPADFLVADVDGQLHRAALAALAAAIEDPSMAWDADALVELAAIAAGRSDVTMIDTSRSGAAAALEEALVVCTRW